MASNLTIYCLEKITDYSEFERLCNDLMSREGCSSIEPLGRFSDKGRDAIHVSQSAKITIFAYSVREDWRAKLAEDASKIHKHGHACDQLVFITTADPTAGERDEAVNFIHDEYKWQLELYGVERLRILLDVKHPSIKALHPQIFPPEFLAIQAKTQGVAQRDHIFISSVPYDAVLADWLTRKLTAEGYQVWCERFKMLGGEKYPDDVDDAIKTKAFRVLGLYSKASLRDPEVMRQRALALNLAQGDAQDFLIPLNVDDVSPVQLDRMTSSLKFISFEKNWAEGLRQLLKKLESIGCPKTLPDGKSVAAAAFLEKDVLSGQAEQLLSNCLQVEKLPPVIHRFKVRKEIPGERLEQLKAEWAYRLVNSSMLLSFHQPPSSIANEYQIHPAGGASWQDVEKINEIWAPNLVSELLGKSLIVKCHEKGLLQCSDTHLHYFPSGLVNGDRLKFIRPDGSKTYVNSVGQRKYWRPAGSEEYCYYLAPSFSVSQNLFDDFVILVRIRIRFTDTDGATLLKRTAQSRRKHLCQGWWNNDWLNRILAVCQFLAEDSKITIGGKSEEQIVINAIPLSLQAPEGINEAALDELSYERAALLDERDDELDERTEKEEGK